MSRSRPDGFAGSLTSPTFTRRDLVAIAIVLAIVPLVVGRPYARVGELRPEGRAYRAYFIADFVWAMAVVGEVSKGDVPPRNPFLAGDALHYYWLADLLPSIEHRATRASLRVEPLILCNSVLLDLAFMAFLYAFVRHFVHSPPAAALSCVAVVLCSSFEGTQQLYQFWRWNVPLDALRDLNIDAMTRWKLDSLPVDGLQRLLLYQPHHATAWALGLSGLLVLMQSRDASRVRVSLLAGILLSASLLMSSFLAVMIGLVAGIFHASPGRGAAAGRPSCSPAWQPRFHSDARWRSRTPAVCRYFRREAGLLRPESGGRPFGA